MKIFLPLLTVALLAAGCVNVHVHFPAAPAEASPSAADAGGTKDK